MEFWNCLEYNQYKLLSRPNIIFEQTQRQGERYFETQNKLPFLQKWIVCIIEGENSAHFNHMKVKYSWAPFPFAELKSEIHLQK